MIAVRDLYAGYENIDILRGITVSAKPGQFVALVGPNGAGKSTLLKTLCGLIPSRDAGSIFMGGKALEEYGRLERAQLVAYLPQARSAPPFMLSKDIVALGRAPYRGALGKISPAGQEAIERAIACTELTSLLARRFGTLSGGERARVLLARALVVGADILLADEPLAALDPARQLEVLQLLQKEAARGKTVIAAMHDLALASAYADEVWVLLEGKMVAAGAPDMALGADILTSVFGVSAPRGGLKAMALANRPKI